ncbi:MAG: NUDIX domain-containing protein [Candidatus Paceibacter sp.]|nr:NUDIX domain-containing protein [Candidatus Paceibacter sp.]
MESHKLFKVNQNAIIRNKSGEILILQRDGKWMLPGGRLESEGWLEGLRREIREETGIENFEVKEILNVDMSDSGETYIVTFLCEAEEKPEVVLSHEHQGYAWLKLENIGKFKFWHEKIRERLEIILRARQ